MLTGKRLAGLFAASILSLSISIPVYGDFIKIYEESTSTPISKGAEYKVINRFYDHGWASIKVLEVNLRDRSTKLKLLTPGPTIKDRLPLTILSEYQNDNVIGAVNGDFFDTNTAESIGPMIDGGDVISSAKNDPRFSVFSLSKDSFPSISYFITDSMELTNTSKSINLKLDYYNKAIKDNAILYIDSRWNPQSFGYSDRNILELVVSNNKIVDIRYNQPAIDIPKDGYIIAATGTRMVELDSFSKGNRLSIKTNMPNEENIELAMGGGAKIVENGVMKQPFTLPISGRHPRTSLGISKDNKTVYLVTVDGRNPSNPGLSQEELASIMMELGAYNAINLDGGGSTEMVVKKPGDFGFSIANTPSSGYERSIANGIGVVNTSITSSLRSINLGVDDNKVFVNTGREIKITGYDKNFNPVNVDSSRVDFKVEGVEGYFKDSKFYPSTSGDAKVTVEYRDTKSTIYLKVLDQPIELNLYPKKISLDKLESTNFDLSLTNADGYTAKLDNEYVTWSFSDDRIQSIEQLRSMSSIKDSIVVSAMYNDFTDHAQIARFYKPTITEDFEFLRGSFASYPAAVQGSYELTNTSFGGSKSGKLSFDFSNVNSNKAAYYVFPNGGKLLEDKTQRVSLQVYGNNGRNHWLRAKVVDANNKSYNLTLARNIDWNGWKEISTDIPNSIPRPIRLERIYVVEPDPTLADTGSILIDTLTEYSLEVVEDKMPTKVVKDKNIPYKSLEASQGVFRFSAFGKKEVDVSDPRIHSMFSGLVGIRYSTEDVEGLLRVGMNIYQPSSYKRYSYKDTTFIEILNNNNGIRSADYTQWTKFISDVGNIENQNVVISLPNRLTFSDPMEKKLFFDTLAKIKSSNKDILLVTGGSSYTGVDKKDGIYILSLKNDSSEEVRIASDNEGIYFIK